MLEKKDGVFDLVTIGRKHLKIVHRNLSTPLLYEQIIKNREGQIAHLGPVVVRTGDYMQRPVADKFVVRDESSENSILWSEKNKGIPENRFDNLLYRMLAYMQNKEAYVQYCWAGQDPEHRISIRFVTEMAWHNLYIRNMFEPITDVEDFESLVTDFSIIHIPGFHAMPDIDGTNSSAFVIINVSQKIMFICGTSYAGEIRQAVFTIMNYLFPKKEVFPMRCSANAGEDGDVAIFIGRGGSGKSTLATDPKRHLVGDHEHGWTEKGLFSFERGAYAKVLNVKQEDEPDIYECTRKFGTILENGSIDLLTRRIDRSDASLTENTRAAYPLSHIPNSVKQGMCGHPSNLFLLTCDAFGVMPPVSKLTPEMAVFAFLSGYTSRLKEDQTMPDDAECLFDTCFGSASLTLPAHAYGLRLMEEIKKHNVKCWLVNTGWSGNQAGHGERIPITITRSIVDAVIAGKLDNVEYEPDPVFQFEVPCSCPGVPDEMLDPRKTATDAGDYELRANRLAKEFMTDYARFADLMPDNMRKMLSEVISMDDSFDLLGDLSFSM